MRRLSLFSGLRGSARPKSRSGQVTGSDHGGDLHQGPPRRGRGMQWRSVAWSHRLFARLTGSARRKASRQPRHNTVARMPAATRRPAPEGKRSSTPRAARDATLATVATPEAAAAPHPRCGDARLKRCCAVRAATARSPALSQPASRARRRGRSERAPRDARGAQ